MQQPFLMFTILNSLRLRSGYFQRKYYFILRFVAPCGALQNAFSREESVRQAASPRPTGRSKTPFHVRGRYGKRHHRALRARSKAVSRKEHAYGKQHRNKPGSFLQEEAPAAFLPVLPFILRWMLLRRRLLLRWRKPFPQRKRSPAQWQRCRLLRKQQPKKLLR